MSDDNKYEIFDTSQDVDIPLPGNLPDHPSIVYHQRRMETLKMIANIIATVTALVMAVAAFFKPNDPINKTAYEELKTAIQINTDNTRENHEDISAIRMYLDGYLASSLVVSSGDGGTKATVIPLTIHPVSSPGSRLSTPPALATALATVSTKNPDAGVGIVIVSPISPAPPLPHLHTASTGQIIPSYEELQK